MIGLQLHGAEEKLKEEIVTLIQAKADRYEIPFVNSALQTSFETGPNVKAYWPDTVMKSAPGQVKGMLFIMKQAN